jgi:hypothetical protein
MAFGFALPKLPTQALAGDPSGAAPLSFADKLMMFGAIAKGHPDMAMQIPLMAQARRTFQQQQAATTDLANAVSGKPIPQRAAGVQYVPDVADDTPPPPAVSVAKDLGALTGLPDDAPMLGQRRPISVGVSAIPPRDPSADAIGGPPSVRGALPMLARLARAGGNVEPWTKMLEAAQPKAMQVNGRVLDEHDPGIYGGYYGEAPTKGAEPVYDANGKQVGWHMADGAIQAIAAGAQATASGTKAGELPFAGPTARATAAGKAEGELPFVAATARAQAAGKAEGENPNTLETHDLNGVPTTMTRQQWLSLAGGAAPGASAAPGQPSAAVTAGGRLDPQAFYKGFVMKHEGGLNPSDLNGAPTMYGFNQTANPDIDVKSLTPETAAQRFEQRYYVPSGAANMPAPLGAVHADTYFINPKKAGQILVASGGNPNKYMDLREQWLNGLVKTQPGAAKYADAWANRNADLRSTVAQLSGQAPSDMPAAAGPPAAPGAAPGVGFHGVNAKDQETVNTAREDAKLAENAASMGHQFQDLNRAQASGPGYRPLHIPIPLIDKVDVNPIGALARQYQSGVPAMEGLSMRLATELRAPGQRLTQAEIMKNLESVPNLRHMPSQNDAAVAGYDQRAQTKRAYANFVSDWLTAHGSLNGADAAWAAKQGQGGGGSPATRPSSPMKAQPMQQIRLKSGGVATVVPVG